MKIKVVFFTNGIARVKGFVTLDTQQELRHLIGAERLVLAHVKGEGRCYVRPSDQGALDDWNRPLITPQIEGVRTQ